jgi:hypothetical protein
MIHHRNKHFLSPFLIAAALVCGTGTIASAQTNNVAIEVNASVYSLEGRVLSSSGNLALTLNGQAKPLQPNEHVDVLVTAYLVNADLAGGAEDRLSLTDLALNGPSSGFTQLGKTTRTVDGAAKIEITTTDLQLAGGSNGRIPATIVLAFEREGAKQIIAFSPFLAIPANPQRRITNSIHIAVKEPSPQMNQQLTPCCPVPYCECRCRRDIHMRHHGHRHHW